MPDTVHLKIHSMQGKIFVSCCDRDLLGQQYSDGKCCLRIPESFYKGTEMDLASACDVIEEHMDRADSIQIIGENIIEHLDGRNVMCMDGVRRVKGVPHLIFIRM